MGITMLAAMAMMRAMVAEEMAAILAAVIPVADIETSGRANSMADRWELEVGDIEDDRRDYRNALTSLGDGAQ